MAADDKLKPEGNNFPGKVIRPEEDNVIRVEPRSANGLIKNASEFLEAARANDVLCCALIYKRKDKTMRAYRFNAEEIETMFFALELLKRDLMEEFCRQDEEVGYDG